MQLSESTLEHLQDEAYAFLCREALQESLAALEREKSAISVTRPPFGMLARKATRDAFTQSMRTVLDNEAALRDRIARLDGINDWLRPLIRNSVSGYLAAASPPYCALLQIAARLDDWEIAAQGLPETLVAFARDVRGVRTAASAPGATSQTCAHELAVLRETAERLERRRSELLLIEQSITALAAGGPAAEIRLPTLPDLQRVAWVARLAVLPVAQVVVELTRVEAEVRTFLAEGSANVSARLEAARDICGNLVENALEEYWNQLRAHARRHYVEERDVDEVLEMLTSRYVDASIKRRQRTLTDDPFLNGR
jgi:predicted metal-dependent hydrolase